MGIATVSSDFSLLNVEAVVKRSSFGCNTVCLVITNSCIQRERAGPFCLNKFLKAYDSEGE